MPKLYLIKPSGPRFPVPPFVFENDVIIGIACFISSGFNIVVRYKKLNVNITKVSFNSFVWVGVTGLSINPVKLFKNVVLPFCMLSPILVFLWSMHDLYNFDNMSLISLLTFSAIVNKVSPKLLSIYVINTSLASTALPRFPR